MRIAGICGECGKYYKGEMCPNCISIKGETLNVILDIPEHFNRGLGEMVRGRADYREKLQEKGLVEIGNEKSYVDPERMRRNKEQAQERELIELRPAAHQMLRSYEPQWN